MRHGRTISRYLIGAIVPYFISSWLLLSVILFVQQAGRFSDIFFSANIPSQLIWQLAFALIPNVIAFTCPMAVLVGTVIGLSKMQGDSELIAIRASGVGNMQILFPVFLLGVLLSVFTFAINIYGVPLAARVVRQVAIQTAIYKLESPIEPGVFNTEVAGYTIYVRDGDVNNHLFYFYTQVNSGYLLFSYRTAGTTAQGTLGGTALGGAMIPALAPATTSMQFTHLTTLGGLSTFSAELLQLDVTGGSLPPGAMVRESPTTASLAAA